MLPQAACHSLKESMNIRLYTETYDTPSIGFAMIRMDLSHVPQRSLILSSVVWLLANAPFTPMDI